MLDEHNDRWLDEGGIKHAMNEKCVVERFVYLKDGDYGKERGCLEIGRFLIERVVVQGAERGETERGERRRKKFCGLEFDVGRDGGLVVDSWCVWLMRRRLWLLLSSSGEVRGRDGASEGVATATVGALGSERAVIRMEELRRFRTKLGCQ